MTRRLSFIVPGDPGQLTGGYLYDAHIVAGLRSRGWTVEVHGLPGRFPDADDEARRALARTLAALPAGRQVVIDGLALGGLPEVALAHAGRLALVALVHHPLAEENGLEASRARCLLASERAALSAARLVISTSPFTARRLADFGVRPARLRVVAPGTQACALAAADANTPRLLCVASVTPRKGHDLLLAALQSLKHLPWTCDCIGSLTRAPQYAAAIADGIRRAGLGERLRLRGERTEQEVREAYAGADLFVLASHYEGYGMVIDEALAAGLPVLTTSGGALAETLPPDAGVSVPPGDAAALAAALRALLLDRQQRLRLRDGARRARLQRRSWTQATDEFAAALDGIGTSPTAD